MPALLLPTEVISLTTQAVKRLLEADNGDAAMLYLAMAVCGGDENKAEEQLRWSGDRIYLARGKLQSLNLVTKEKTLEPPPKPADAPPEYTRTDMANALQESEFKALTMEMERLMGHILSEADMKKLYTMYDFYDLPAEVILTLATFAIQEERRKRNNASYMPMMSRVLKEARKWKKQGVDTLDRGEEYLRRQEKINEQEWDILSTVGVQERRAAVEKERTYISRWIDVGYSLDLIRLAYERTVYQLGDMNWPYLDKILRNWENAGLRTPEDVELVDHPKSRSVRTVKPGEVQKKQESTQPSQERIRSADDWMDEFLDEGDGKKEE